MKSRKLFVLLPLPFFLISCGQNDFKELTRLEGLTKANEIKSIIESESFKMPEKCHYSFLYKTREKDMSDNQKEDTLVSLKNDYFYDYEEGNPYCHWLSVMEGNKKAEEGWIYVNHEKGYYASIDINESKTYKEIALSDVASSITNVLKKEFADPESVKAMNINRLNEITEEFSKEDTSAKAFAKEDGAFKISAIIEKEECRNETEVEFNHNLISKSIAKETFELSAFGYESSLELNFDWQGNIERNFPNLDEFTLAS